MGSFDAHLVLPNTGQRPTKRSLDEYTVAEKGYSAGPRTRTRTSDLTAPSFYHTPEMTLASKNVQPSPGQRFKLRTMKWPSGPNHLPSQLKVLFIYLFF